MPLCIVSVVKLGHPFVHDDNARAGCQSPSRACCLPSPPPLVHQEESVTVPLNAGLQAIGGGYGPVAAGRSAVHEKDSLAPCAPMMKPALTTSGNTKNGDCSRFTFGARRILRYQLL